MIKTQSLGMTLGVYIPINTPIKTPLPQLRQMFVNSTSQARAYATMPTFVFQSYI